MHFTVIFSAFFEVLTGKRQKQRQLPQFSGICEHPPSPFQAELLEKFRGSATVIRPNIQAPAQPCGHPHARELRQILRHPPLLLGKAEANEQQLRPACAYPLKDRLVFPSPLFKVAVGRAADAKPRHSLPQPLSRTLGHAGASAQQKDRLSPLCRSPQKCFSEVDARHPFTQRPSHPLGCPHNANTVRQDEFGCIEQLPQCGLPSAPLQHHGVRGHHPAGSPRSPLGRRYRLGKRQAVKFDTANLNLHPVLLLFCSPFPCKKQDL